MKEIITVPYRVSMTLLGGRQLDFNVVKRKFFVSYLFFINELKTRNIAPSDGVIYFLFSSCGKYMKIGRVRSGDITARIRCVLLDHNYKQYNFNQMFVVNNWNIEVPVHKMFAIQRAKYKVGTERFSYKEMCHLNGYKFDQRNMSVCNGTGELELFKTENCTPEKIRRILINRLLDISRGVTAYSYKHIQS